MQVWIVFLAFFCYRSVADSGNGSVAKPEVYSLHVESDIQFRFAHTVITTEIANPANISQEISFSAILPETAFVSSFEIVVDGHVYKAYVKEKEAAQKEYTEAVEQGQTAAQVVLSARDSNRFTVSVNVEPRKNVTFNLTYDELLSRTLGVYRDVINLDPGQIVPDLSVVVRINETNDITTLNVPALRTSNEIEDDPAPGITNPLATVERLAPNLAVVKFAPSPEQQKELAQEGIKGQLIVEYDVNRTETPGEVLVNDGYFVNFFAPIKLSPLPKEVTFVLDISGSMAGRKIEQLRQAMVTILGDLNPGDLFSIIIFSTDVQVWDPTRETSYEEPAIPRGYPSYPGVPTAETLSPNVIVAVNDNNIAKAKQFVEKLTEQGSTNIYDALQKGLEVSSLGQSTLNSSSEQEPEPIIIFLTDGQPNVGVSNPDEIVSGVTKANTGNVSIFSLALGDDADLGFLRKLSLRNTGFARKIYEASDTALQLRDFYRQVASPLLSHVTFKYLPSQVVDDSVTRRIFRRYFSGSELVVAGRLQGDNITAEAQGLTVSGLKRYPFIPIIIPRPHIVVTEPSTLERLWAYLTIQQLLEDDEAEDYDRNDKNYTSPQKQQALELALKYSFVTPLTSLVVVKPNGTSSVNPEDASGPGSPSSYGGASGGQNSFVYAKVPAPIYVTTPAPYLPPRTTTNNPVPVLANLSDVTWLPPSSANNTISLPTGPNGTDEELHLASANQTNVAYSSCSTPSSGSGHCRHLRFCVLTSFTNSEDEFLQYFCPINSASETYVGVCCPDSL